MRLIRLHHVQIMIPKEAETKAREYYADVLGLLEVEKPEALRRTGGLWFELGDIEIHLGLASNPVSKDSRQHIAIQVDDVDGWSEKLRNKGIEVKEGIEIPGFRRIEFRDPFNNRIEFLESTTK